MFVRGILGMVLAMALPDAPPETPRCEAVDTYHDVKVLDPYRWLEDSKSSDVRRWSAAQNAWARAYLDALPDAAAIKARVAEIMLAKTVSYSDLKNVGGRLFFMKREPPKQQPFLMVMNWPGDPATADVLVDPNVLDPQGGTSIDWYVPSPDGKLLAVSLSQGGSESGDVHLFDAATGRDTHEIVPRAHGGTAGGSLSWAADSSGFFYSRLSAGRRAAGRRSRLLHASLFPQAGDADRRRPLRTRQSFSANRRDQADHREVRPRARDDAARRRRRVRALSPLAGRKVDADQPRARSDCRRRVWASR